MDIKKVIDAERWWDGHPEAKLFRLFQNNHNDSLDRLEQAAVAYVSKLEAQLCELKRENKKLKEELQTIKNGNSIS